MIDEFIQGQISKETLLEDLGRSYSWLVKELRKRGITGVSHVYLTGYGYQEREGPLLRGIYDRYQAGETSHDLAKEFKVPQTTLCYLFKRNNWPIRDQAERAQKGWAKNRSTNLNLYGTEVPIAQPGLVWDKAKKTLQNNHGVLNPRAAPIALEKRRQYHFKLKLKELETLLPQFGYLFLDDYKGIFKNRNFSTGGYEGRVQYKILHKICGRIFEDDVEVMPRCPICFPLVGNHPSKQEEFYRLFIESLGFAVETNSRSKVQSQRTRNWFELDLYVPGRNVAFEHNGLYWHSLGHALKGSWGREKSSQYHVLKTNSALAKGIKLYHIWEHHNPEIVKSRISQILGKSKQRLGARQLQLAEIPSQEANAFLDKNHLHGGTVCKKAWALKDQTSQLVQCLTVRNAPEDTLEIARMATARDTVVSGGAFRLFRQVIAWAQSLNYKRLLTYADRDWSPKAEDTVYSKFGFTLLGDSGPSMWYTNFSWVKDRRHFQKHKLKELFPQTYDDALTEQQILSLNKIYPLYNSGNWKFEWVLI